MSGRRLVLTFLLILFGVALGDGQQRPGGGAGAGDQRIAPALKNLGTFHRNVTTRSERAQMFFDQGLRLVYGFNHAEAVRSFKEAARLDADCAMCSWGQALALGPNINDPLPPDREREAYAAIQEALVRKAKASEQERAYIDALAVRYAKEPRPDDRARLDAAFVAEMKKTAARYPDDPDAATIYAAASMETCRGAIGKKGSRGPGRSMSS